MKVLTLSNYDEFSCIGSKCLWTCCRGWKIHIDEESLKRYHSVSGRIGDEMRNSVLYDKKGSAFIKMNEDGFCPLLDKQKLCRIYLEAGEDKMCNTCKIYPRGVNIFGDLYLKYICISCPEMARMLFTQKEPLVFNIVEDEKIPLPKSDGFDWNRFDVLKDGMTTTICILQNRRIPVNVRLQMALFFNDMFQECLLNKGDTDEIVMMFAERETTEVILRNLQRFQRRTEHLDRMILEFNRQIVAKSGGLWDIIRFIKDAFGEFKEAEKGDVLSLAEFMNREELSIVFENYCVYYVMQHYLKSYEKRDPQKCIVKMIQFCAIFAWLFGLYSQKKKRSVEDYAVIVSLFARKTEHTPDYDSVFDVVCDSLCEQGMGTTDYLLSVLA